MLIAKRNSQEDSILEGCVPPDWKPYMLQFQWPQPDAALWGTLPDLSQRGTLPCDLFHDEFDVSPHPVNRQMPVKQYLPANVFARGVNWQKVNVASVCVPH